MKGILNDKARKTCFRHPQLAAQAECVAIATALGASPLAQHLTVNQMVPGSRSG